MTPDQSAQLFLVLRMSAAVSAPLIGHLFSSRVSKLQKSVAKHMFEVVQHVQQTHPTVSPNASCCHSERAVGGGRGRQLCAHTV